MSVVIHNGWFDAVIGRVVRSEKFIFVPVMGDICKERIDINYVGKTIKYSRFDIADYIDYSQQIIKLFVTRSYYYESLNLLYWVRGRMTAIFGYGVPLPKLNTALNIDLILNEDIESEANRLCELEVQTNNQLILIDQSFIACMLDDKGIWQAYIFRIEDDEPLDCSDASYPTAVLHFYKNTRLNQVYQEITKDFCKLLIQEIDSLYPFSGCHSEHDGLCASIRNVFFSKEDGFYTEEYCIE